MQKKIELEVFYEMKLKFWNFILFTIHRYFYPFRWIVHEKSTIWCVNAGNETKLIDQNLEKYIYSYNEKIWVINHPHYYIKLYALIHWECLDNT